MGPKTIPMRFWSVAKREKARRQARMAMASIAAALGVTG